MQLENGSLRISASDLSDFLACRHLTRQSQRVALGELAKPKSNDAGFDALVERGKKHEKQVLDRFKADYSDVVELDPWAKVPDALENARKATLQAIDDNVDVIYQAVLRMDDQLGLPDFLVRADLLESDRGGYEVVDAKLARSAKARAVLQTTFYSRLLTDITGVKPWHLHLALGGHDALQTFKVSDFAAYERQVANMLGEFLPSDDDPYPDPVEHCAICRWSWDCRKRRRDDDHLSLVAGITKRQRKLLEAVKVTTLEAFGDLAPGKLPDPSLANSHAQARIQLKGRRSGQPESEFRDLERDDDDELVPDRGLLALPEPSAGDLFFDIEGARFYSEDDKTFGLQYLFGIVDTADIDPDTKAPRYHQIWSFNRAQEKPGFEELIDFFVKRREANPGLHIYHYSHYEPTAVDALSAMHDTMHEAVGDLMGRLATREEAVDDLLRQSVFVDLYRVVRQGIRASVESYSIKRLEDLIGYERKVELADVNERMVIFEAALEDGTAADDVKTVEIIRGYNEDDCRSTLQLRDWLEARRAELEAGMGIALPRPAAKPPQVTTRAPEVQAVLDALMEGVPDDPAQRSETQTGRALMADLLEWHKREDKPKWWHFFYLRGLSDEEMLAHEEVLAGLTPISVEAEKTKNAYVRFRFPEQDHPFDTGDRYCDALSPEDFPTERQVIRVDDEAGEIVVACPKEGPYPRALVKNPVISTDAMRDRLFDLGTEIAALRGDWPHSPAYDLLLRCPPRLANNQPIRKAGEPEAEAGARAAVALHDSCLPVQGPPGTGKTYAGARMVLDLVAEGKTVGVAANSHAVIDNLLAEVVKVAEDRKTKLPRIGQKVSPDYEQIFKRAQARGEVYGGGPKDAIAAMRNGDVEVLGGTSWLWAHEDATQLVDVLIVDEAGQLSLANTLAASAGCKNLVLLGDPMQLAQPSQAAHPVGAGVSALEHILQDEPTMPEHLGLFIRHTRRMHPDLCAFTSEVFYDDKLEPIPGLENQRITGGGDLAGTGLRTVEVRHEGNTSASPEEAEAVAKIVSSLLGRYWVNPEEVRKKIGPNDVLIVTPFNAQIREIEAALQAADYPHDLVGTVDKFQGREAPVTIYSLASSSAEDAPRGMEFLYQLNRLNVATSRARCVSVLVASPELARVFCSTPRQMQLANALCRSVDLISSVE